MKLRQDKKKPICESQRADYPTCDKKVLLIEKWKPVTIQKKGRNRKAIRVGQLKI